MIVEDEAIIAQDMARQLERNGCRIDFITDSGEKALAHLNHSRPDLVLLDVRLRGQLDGIDTAKRIRSKYGLPVIFLSGSSDPATMARMMNADPVAVIVKPLRPTKLVLAIEKAIQRQEEKVDDVSDQC